MSNSMNYYELLGIKNDATEAEIKIAYKSQMKKWHPDLNKSDEAVSMSSKINEAKEVLLDIEKRKDYDEYLSRKETESYNRYTQRKANSTQEQTNNTNDSMVTKWEYLRDWLKFSTYKPIRKIIGTIGVLFESLLCLIIKLILILLAFICNMGSYMIRNLFNYLSPVIGIMAFLLVAQFLTNGLKEVIKQNKEILRGIIILLLVYLSSFILPLLSNLILSPKVFNVLYNKIDINLFKKCVGYKD